MWIGGSSKVTSALQQPEERSVTRIVVPQRDQLALVEQDLASDFVRDSCLIHSFCCDKAPP